MQTFLPYSDFYQSALAIDPSFRLGNQFYREGITLIRGGWRNHPASKMWQGHFYTLGKYLLACAQVLEIEYGRSYPQHTHEIRYIMRKHKNCEPPEWLGDERVHRSHRANLLMKGIKDNTFIKYRKFGPKLKKHWTKETYENIWREFGQPESLWYWQFNWKVKPTEGYYWPVN